MHHSTRFSIALVVVSLLSVSFTVYSAAAAEPAAKTPTKAELEKQFEESMHNVVMSGHYTKGDDISGKDLPEDHYHIAKVTKLKDDTWVFDARIEVEGQDITLPVPLKVLWAGNTPVITLDEFTIPGLGTFSARILILGDRYAGVWTHGDGGGQMFGQIEKETKDKSTK